MHYKNDNSIKIRYNQLRNVYYLNQLLKSIIFRYEYPLRYLLDCINTAGVMRYNQRFPNTHATHAKDRCFDSVSKIQINRYCAFVIVSAATYNAFLSIPSPPFVRD